MAINISDSKTAEFARLLNFFERLASYKSHSRDDNNVTNADNIKSIPLPADLAPVVKNLAKIVSSRNPSPDGDQPIQAMGRKRSHTVATISRTRNCNDAIGISEDGESLAKFPLQGKKYAFTFRLMMHKLYQMEDWRQKVKEVLERSQNDYKPLSETNFLKRGEGKKSKEEPASREGRVHFHTGERKPGGHPQTISTIAFGKFKDEVSASPYFKVPLSPIAKSGSSKDDSRALKKRCVGRRKSLTGPAFAKEEQVGSGWIYDATVSSTETDEKREPAGYQEVREAMRAMSAKHAGLRIGITASAKVTRRRRVSLGGPNVASTAYNVDEGLVGRRALSVADKTVPTQLQRKRPLEF
ncbi:hypothetical protein H0H92_006326 [Tricholoma furcatifolium]|nr:hypothetical protein H0H92_006326 [Tricholoma furcatifolium]